MSWLNMELLTFAVFCLLMLLAKLAPNDDKYKTGERENGHL